MCCLCGVTCMGKGGASVGRCSAMWLVPPREEGGKKGWCVHGCLTSRKSPDGLSIHCCCVLSGQAKPYLGHAQTSVCCVHTATQHTQTGHSPCAYCSLFSAPLT